MRAVVALVASLAGLGLAEAALRLGYDDLPSLAPLAGAELRVDRIWERRSSECGPRLVSRDPPRGFDAPGFDPPLRVWFAGDSTTAAVQVPDADSWWAGVAGGLARSRGQRVAATNLAVPGARHCAIPAQIQTQLDAGSRADLLLVGIFADDLLGYEMYSVEGHAVLLPSSAPPAIRAIVTRSYLANLAWLAIEPHRRVTGVRRIEPRALPDFEHSIDRLAALAGEAGARAAFVVMPPSGLRDCARDVPPDHACYWLRDDLDRMARALVAEGHAVVDLRPLFAATALPVLAADEQAVAEGRIPIAYHVATAGQAAIAGEVLRQLPGLDLLGPPPEPDPGRAAAGPSPGRREVERRLAPGPPEGWDAVHGATLRPCPASTPSSSAEAAGSGCFR
jgi:hypothetical protein